MYGRKAGSELERTELEEARLGFIHYLRRKRFSPQFIASHGEDLFATAALEYSRKLAEGERIESPAGWLITCAWRRTKSLLEAEGRSPRVVSTEKAEVIRDEVGQGPEDAALDEDRLRRIHAAVEQLPADEQRLLELAYFEEMPVREAARQLDWHPSKAQRCHEAARRRLHELLGVESLDELEVDVGLAAYVSIAGAGSSSLHFPDLGAIAEAVERGAAHGWARAQDLARRLPFGGSAEPSVTATLGGSAGRAAGVCATAALACFASGVVGPGVGGINLISGNDHGRQGATAQNVAPARPRGLAAIAQPTPPEPPARTSAGEPRSEGRGRADQPAPQATRERRAQQAVRSQSLESAAGPPEEAASTPVESAPVAETSSPPTSAPSAPAPSPTKVANDQFGP
jgi:RNA polymerase sigma factor (sigma-70 family)